ncbi:aspartate aminotransferase family protein [Ktedonosporobacter rubrisoli]|uniref:Aspartate aminotransferase family protein n=2 Tax=Ktedonosporobacter rubrisoli TaxID=2509675 RepID=A0A4P6K6V7_KTERU|nr:aspartate aminotransferase family protein [Ktedonosporobacter rubrisoli]
MISPFRQVLEQTLTHALSYLEQLEQAPVGATVERAALRQRLGRQFPEAGIEATQVIDELVTDMAGGIIGSAGGRFFGWVIGGTLPAALAADWLTATWDQNSARYTGGPAEAVIEEVCGAWLKEILGLPQEASFALVTGSQMAHVTCLAAARHALLERVGWDVERAGLAGAPPIRVLTSTEHHKSLERALRLLGLGTDSLRVLPVDEYGRLLPATLAQALAKEADFPTIVVLQAGDLNIGAYDPFAELIPLAHQFKAWVHIDGAFGLWAQASPSYRHLLRGVDQADSWITDGHKWLNTPYDCGYAFVAHPQAHRGALAQQADYIVRTEAARDPSDWNPEWSRRGRGVATYAALRQLGRKGIADLIERCCQHAETLVTQIGSLPGAQIVWKPQVNQGLVRFLDKGPTATQAQHDRRTDTIIARIAETGEAFFSGTTWRGQRCMRVSVCNWQTSEQDVARAVAAVERVLMQE